MAESTDDSAIATFTSFTGQPAEQAKVWLEMAGGNAEAAISMFFSMGGTGAPAAAAPEPTVSNVDPVVSTVWERPAEISDSWTKQTLSFDEDGFGIPQTKNGPCGVLAVIQATLIARRFRATGKCDVEPFSNEDLAAALAECLWKCRNPEVVVASFNGDEISRTPIGTLEDLEKYCISNLNSFAGENGLLLFVYSAVLSRTLEQVGKEAELPLIVGPFALATTDLLSLLMRGNADGNVGAYTQTGTVNVWPESDIGMLSWQEISSKIPLADGLKFPKSEVYVLHGGDHFTTMFQSGEPGNYYHYNGLPPAGPRLAQLTIDPKNGECGKAPPQHKESYLKPVPNEIEDIVQARKEDKEARPKGYQTWQYECVLAIDDPSVSGASRPESYVPETFEYGSPPEGAWRCASCYRTRFQTMCFGKNPEGTDACVNCGKHNAEALWTVWLEFSELPVRWQHKMAIRNAPKITPVLWTKWPGATINYIGENPSV